MWPFGLKGSKVDEDRLATLSRRLDDCESKTRTLTTEWLDTLDRIERVLGRLTKRAQRQQLRDEADGQEVAEAEPPTSDFDREIAIRRQAFRPGGTKV